MRIPIDFEHWNGKVKFTGGVGLYDDGRPGEVFLTGGKTGTEMQTIVSDAAIAASLALQFGAPLETLKKAFLRNEDGSAAGPLGKLFDILAEEGKR